MEEPSQAAEGGMSFFVTWDTHRVADHIINMGPGAGLSHVPWVLGAEFCAQWGAECLREQWAFSIIEDPRIVSALGANSE